MLSTFPTNDVLGYLPTASAIKLAKNIGKLGADLSKVKIKTVYNPAIHKIHNDLINAQVFYNVKLTNETLHLLPRILRPNLHTLDLSETNVSDVSTIGSCIKANPMLGGLHTLNLSDTDVSDVSALGGLHTLDLSFTKVSNVSMLSGLHTLDLSRTKVSDVSAVENIPNLIT